MQQSKLTKLNKTFNSYSATVAHELLQHCVGEGRLRGGSGGQYGGDRGLETATAVAPLARAACEGAGVGLSASASFCREDR